LSANLGLFSQKKDFFTGMIASNRKKWRKTLCKRKKSNNFVANLTNKHKNNKRYYG